MCDHLENKSAKFGLFSGKYDSTKQRAVLLQGDRLRNYRRYNSTIRMEMLLTGGVIVTDAQFYDGLYFAWMTDDVRKESAGGESQLDQLLEFAERYNQANPESKIFCIKQREIGIDKLAERMFYKRWLFSSLESRELANFINVIGNEFDCFYVYIDPKDLENPKLADIIGEAKNKMTDCADKNMEVSLRREEDPLWKKPATLHDYLREMHGRIQSVYGDVYDKEWEHFSNRLTALFTEAANANHVTEKWIGTMRYHEELETPYHSNMTYRERFRGILKEFRDAMSQLKQSYGCILRIENEIDKIVPIRSKIEMELDEISRIADTSMENDAAAKKSCRKKVSELRTQFEQLFNDRYNKGLAMHHHAEFIDVCDCPQHTEEVIGNLTPWKEMTVEISQEAVIKLGLMSWKQFAIVASNSKVIQARRKLWEMYRNDKISMERFNEILRQYLQQIEKKISKRGKSDWKVKGGPWDYYYTNIYDLHDDFFKNRQPSFIGGGSFIEGKEANEVCLYRECEEGMCLHRIRIKNAENPEEDKAFDTILAPVQNVFNGKR